MKYHIAFFCQSIPFTDKTIRLETSLGGSESALVMMVNALAERGHTVRVFTQIDDVTHRGEHNGVWWYDYDDMKLLCKTFHFDSFISLRMPSVFQNSIQAKHKAIWNQDELLNANDYYANLWQVDESWYVSDWQRQHYESQLPDNLKSMAFVTKNCIDLDLIEKSIQGVEKKENKFIYISRPERGLRPLLEIFARYRQSHTNAELYVCRYESMYEPNPGVKAMTEWADKAVAHADGVSYLGNLNKEQLYRHIAESKLMLYPGVENFNETSCIAALEAQACGTPLICSAKGGLNETLHERAGVHLKGESSTDEYQREFCLAIDMLCSTPVMYEAMRSTGREYALNHYQAQYIAEEWEAHLDEFFGRRYSENKRAVYDNLIAHDDLQAASKVALDMSMPQLFEDFKTEWVDEKETPDEYAETASHPKNEYRDGDRFHFIREILKGMGLKPENILDYASGNGAMGLHIRELYPNADLLCVDYSDKLCDIAREFIVENTHAGNGITEVLCGSLEQVENFHGGREKFDLIFCGEYLEHCWEPETFINQLQSHLSDDGWLVWTVPVGPWHELMDKRFIKTRGHKVHWEYNTIVEVFSDMPTFAARYLPMGTTKKGNEVGHWVIRHKKHDEIGQIDFAKKMVTMRPYQSVSLCMITRDEEDNLSKCLKSVWDVVDEVIIADNGSTDRTKDIAAEYNATIIELPEKCPDAPQHLPAPGSFEWMRNKSIEGAKGDWIFWIDADEELINPHQFRKYLDSPAFNGFVVRQNHLMIDMPTRWDTPVRVLRNNMGYKFYGAIHEHCMASLNDIIEPNLTMSDVDILHYGYINEVIRREKCQKRNQALLGYDREIHPDRKLGELLLAREYQNLIKWKAAEHGVDVNNGGLPTHIEDARAWATVIVRMWNDLFSDYKHPQVRAMFPCYQFALRCLNTGLVSPIVDKLDGYDQQLRFESEQAYIDFQKYQAQQIFSGASTEFMTSGGIRG